MTEYPLSILRQAFASPLAVTAVLFFCALLLAEGAVRAIRVPRIAALILAGALLGWWRKNLPAADQMPVPATLLEALAMVLLFEVGQRVPLEWIRSNPWLLLASIGETASAFCLIFVVLAYGFGLPLIECGFVGVICMAASPIVIMSVSKDLRARGQVAERALLFSTLSSVYAALAMQLLTTAYLAAAHAKPSVVLQPVFQLLGSFVLGSVAAGALRLYAVGTRAHGAVLTIGVICLCVLLFACAPPLGLSPILSALFFGLAVRVTDRSHRLLAYQSSETGAVLTLGYFILLGASFVRPDSGKVAAIAAALVVVRALAKVATNALLAGSTALHPRKGALVGLALSPLSSLALTLAAGLSGHAGLEQAAQTATAVVMVMAIFGPLMTEVALRLAGEPTRHEP
ncbi:MAG TPA: cation:proton antiporter [Burkholderiaceae bacterium]|nr:cation:proton antiporter [Burkholderiaceae bacterium]